MPRPEKRIDPRDGPIAEFACALRGLRASAALTYRRMAERAHYSATALSQTASGTRLPTWEVTRAFVRACGGDEEEWRARWEEAARAVRESGAGPAEARDEDGAAYAGLDPAEALTEAQLMEVLDRVRREAGIGLRELAARSREDATYPAALSRTTLSDLLRGTGRPPRLEDVLQIVWLCGGSEADLDHWTRCWDRLHGTSEGSPPSAVPVREQLQETMLAEHALEERRAQAEEEEEGEKRTPDAGRLFSWRLVSGLLLLLPAVLTTFPFLLDAFAEVGESPQGMEISLRAATREKAMVLVDLTYRCEAEKGVAALGVAVVRGDRTVRGRTAVTCDGETRRVFVPTHEEIAAAELPPGTRVQVNAYLLDVRAEVLDDGMTERQLELRDPSDTYW